MSLFETHITPAYLRARTEAIQLALQYELSLPESRSREMRIAYLRNGHVPDNKVFMDASEYEFVLDGATTSFEVAIEKLMPKFDNSPLTQIELHTYDSWFTMHPEKVCGRQIGGTGFSFPVKTIGTKQDIVLAIELTLKSAINKVLPNTIDFELEAEAIALELELLNV